MLTISKPLSTGQAHSYHEQDFANSEQNYYSEARRVTGYCGEVKQFLVPNCTFGKWRNLCYVF